MPTCSWERSVGTLLPCDVSDLPSLAQIIEASKSWRDGWVSILSTQIKLVTEFQLMYQPIVGGASSDDDHTSVHATTPPEVEARPRELMEVYAELRTELLEEVNTIDDRIIKPAMDARDSIQPLKKVIKKREDRKLDFERYHGRVDTMKKKKGKLSERDTASLVKTERELVRSTDEYAAADDHIRAVLPPVINAAFSLIPCLLDAQILIQNALLAQYYTYLHDFCSRPPNAGKFPSPPSEMDEVIADWDASFRPVQQELETSIHGIASGKAVRQPMKFEDQAGPTMMGLNLRNGVRQKRIGDSTSAVTNRPRPVRSKTAPLALPPPASLPEIPEIYADALIKRPPRPRIPSSSTDRVSSASPVLARIPSTASPSLSEYVTPGSTGSGGTPRAEALIHSSLQPKRANKTHAPNAPDDAPYSAAASMAASIAAKKKAPPPKPPPMRRQFSSQSDSQFVIALYAFEGQNADDLSFREGDRIRIVTRTDTKEDWWEGEVDGRKGWFPRNYCR